MCIFPTDLNLLWDAGRKCVDLIVKYRDELGYALPGWRKAKEWRRQLKRCERLTSQIVYRGGPNKEARVKRAVRDYLTVGGELSAKGYASLLDLCDQPADMAHWEGLEYFHRMLDKHLDLVAAGCCRRKPFPRARKCFPCLNRTPSGSRKASNAQTWNWAIGCSSRRTNTS